MQGRPERKPLPGLPRLQHVDGGVELRGGRVALREERTQGHRVIQGTHHGTVVENRNVAHDRRAALDVPQTHLHAPLASAATPPSRSHGHHRTSGRMASVCCATSQPQSLKSRLTGSDTEVSLLPLPRLCAGPLVLGFGGQMIQQSERHAGGCCVVTGVHGSRGGGALALQWNGDGGKHV